MNRGLVAQLVLLFLATQALGLFTADYLVREGVRATLVTDNPEDVENSLGLFAYILGFTAVLLVLIKFLKDQWLYWVFKCLETAAVFFASLLVFNAFTDSLLILLAAAALVVARLFFTANLWLRNLATVLSTAGAGALIGGSLGVWPVAVLLGLLCVYDYVAVFKTKHMVTLAKSVASKNLSFTYALPTKEHVFELGAGDMVMPLTFAASALAAAKTAHAFPLYWVPSAAVLVASLAGLLATLLYASKRAGKPLPALPLQGALMLAAWGATKLAGF